jgi:hypothetical protein
MAYNTKLKTDVNGKPIPQYYNQATREYEALEGNNGAARHIIYGADGNPIATAGNKLAVRASEIETLLESLDGKDFATQATLAEVLAKLSDDPATQTTLAAILAKIIDAPATEAKQDTIIGHVDGIEGALTTLNDKDFATQTTLSQILAKIIAAPATEAKQDALIGHVDGVESALASILEKLIAAPATEAKQDALAALIGEVQASPTANTLLARLKSLEDKIAAIDSVLDAIVDGSTPAVTQLSGSNIIELMSDMNAIKERQEEVWRTINILTQKQAPPEIFGVKWDKGSVPTLTRTDDAANLTANAGVGFSSVTNDFDSKPIYGEIEQVEDALGNTFMKVPKCYCRDTDGVDHKQMQISKRRYPGFYLPYLFWDFANNKELDYVLIGKHQASLGAGNKLESKPNKYPLVGTNIVDFRTYAKNNNVDGLTGYQQNDIHWVNLLQKLMIIEFATLDIQSVMKGYTEGQYTSTHLATATETGVNRIIVANAHADLYRVGQAISVGTSQGGNQVFYGRTITAIEEYDADNKAIYFDGDPVDITTGNMLYNSGWKTGFSNQLLASSGSIVANDGKYPCVYRGIESPFGDVWEFVDGLNIDDRQAWICKNAANYASNLFASPYEQLGYVNHDTNGYIQSIGFDPNFPFAQLPTAITGSTTPTQYYGDYYYQDVGKRIARFGGYWSLFRFCGAFLLELDYSSSTRTCIWRAAS